MTEKIVKNRQMQTTVRQATFENFVKIAELEKNTTAGLLRDVVEDFIKKYNDKLNMCDKVEF